MTLENEKFRKHFEEWYNTSGNKDCPSIKRAGESYSLMQTHLSWEVWKSASAQNQQTIKELVEALNVYSKREEQEGFFNSVAALALAKAQQ